MVWELTTPSSSNREPKSGRQSNNRLGAYRVPSGYTLGAYSLGAYNLGAYMQVSLTVHVHVASEDPLTGLGAYSLLVYNLEV